LLATTNTDLTNYEQKNSIINIQDLGLSAASQHFVGGQPILRVIFRKVSILESLFYFKKKIYLKKKIQDISGQSIP
jgi:hypothetical protein